MQGVDSMPENIESKQQSAKHLAARAVMAYRAGFPVALLSATSDIEHRPMMNVSLCPIIATTDS